MFADVIANNDNQNNPREREALYKAGRLTFTNLGGDRYRVEDTGSDEGPSSWETTFTRSGNTITFSPPPDDEEAGRVTQTGPPNQLVWIEVAG